MINKSSFSRKVFILLAIKACLFFALISRLFFLQIRNNQYFSNLSSSNKTNSIPILPQRGLISDCFFAQLAINNTVWELKFIKSWLTQPINELIDKLKQFIKISQKDIDNIITFYKRKHMFEPILIKSNLSQIDIATIETYMSLFPEVFISPKYVRKYPAKEATAHIVGYIGKSNIHVKDQNLLIGKQGVENALNNLLQGNLGYKKYEINAKGKVIKQINTVSPTNGKSITLTIDSVLQQQIYNIIKNLTASVVVIDTETANIIACSSSPSFDPNLFVNGINSKQWNNIIKNPENPLSNRAISGLYPPASTLKPFVAMLALERGVITPNSKTVCKGYTYIGNQKFHCWKHTGHGSLNVYEAIEHSCDVFFYELSTKLSPNDFTNLGKMLLLDQNILPMLLNSVTGNIPFNKFTSNIHLGELAISAIGQGEWLTTPLHLANMANIVANNGIIKKLQILEKIDFDNRSVYSKVGQSIGTLPFNGNNIALIQDALSIVIKDNTTAWPVAGKTGTAQVVRITQEQRLKGLTNKSSKRKYREHGMFMGYFPIHQPKYALGIVVEHIGFASNYVIPIAKKVSNLMYNRSELYEQKRINLQKILSNVEQN